MKSYKKAEHLAKGIKQGRTGASLQRCQLTATGLVVPTMTPYAD
ncbi:MAG: hypothetical protein ACK5M7_00775 [Draconibacterium sp.]